MEVALQALVNCLMLGGLYTLIAVGLSLVFSVMRIVNFAHGQMYMLGAYAVFFAYGSSHLPFGVSLLLAAVGIGVFGALVERIVIRPVGGDESRAMVATLGLMIAIGGAATVLFGETGKTVQSPITGTIGLGPTTIEAYRLVAVAVSLLAVGGLFAVLKWTRFGLALRALAQDGDAAVLQGVKVGPTRALGFAVGAGLAAIAGGLVLPINSVGPTVGEEIILKMFIIVIIGGLSSVSGAVLGAFTLAAFETFGVTYVGDLSIMLVYLLVIAVILIKPEGLASKPGRGSA